MKYLFILLILYSKAFSQTNHYSANDLKALKLFPGKWANYWNSHNVDSMAVLLTDDVDFINVAGIWTKNKEELIKQSRERHEGMFKNGIWTTDSVSIKYLKPDIAILHVGWGVSGDTDPDGKPRNPRHGIFTWLLVKRKGTWLLWAAHNVNIRSTL